MAINIRDAQSRLINSGLLSKIGSNPNDTLDYDSVVEEIVKLWGESDFIPAIKKSITDKGLNASKQLLQSIGMDVVTRGNNVVRFRLLADPHWIYAEEGRKAGKRPPLKAIEDWITFKGIQVRENNQESKLTVLQRRRNMAKRIQYAIGKRGTIARFGHKGSDFLKSVAPQSASALSELLSKALGYAVMVELKSAFKK